MIELETVRVKSLIRLRWRTRFRIRRHRRQLRRILTPVGLAMLDEAGRESERQVLFGDGEPTR